MKKVSKEPAYRQLKLAEVQQQIEMLLSGEGTLSTNLDVHYAIANAIVENNGLSKNYAMSILEFINDFRESCTDNILEVYLSIRNDKDKLGQVIEKFGREAADAAFYMLDEVILNSDNREAVEKISSLRKDLQNQPIAQIQESVIDPVTQQSAIKDLCMATINKECANANLTAKELEVVSKFVDSILTQPALLNVISKLVSAENTAAPATPTEEKRAFMIPPQYLQQGAGAMVHPAV